MPFIEVRPTAESKAKKRYRGAAGEPIPVLGEQIVDMVTAEGHARKARWKVCPVKRPLLSMSQIVAMGHEVHLRQNDPHIVNMKNGQKTSLRSVGNVYELDLWVWRPANAKDQGMGVSGFTRPAA